jgi:hypothetical protein
VPTPESTTEPTALVLEEDILVRKCTPSCEPFLDLQDNGLFHVPFKKVHRRVNHIEEICTIEVHDGNYPDIRHGGFVQRFTHQNFQVVKIRSIYGSVEFLRKNDISS